MIDLPVDSPQDCLSNTQETLKLLQSIGWNINWEKSLLSPSQTVEFLSLLFNLDTMVDAPLPFFLQSMTITVELLSMFPLTPSSENVLQQQPNNSLYPVHIQRLTTPQLLSV